MLNALSIDLEDWYHPELVRKFVLEKEDLIVESTMPLLKMLDSSDVKATFFVLGAIAEKHPELIREIHGRGHEIASHGYSHMPLHLLDEKNFENEMRRATKLLEAITGEKPIGFRAPSFSLEQSTKWALSVLEKLGYKYDSSILPSNVSKLAGLYGVSSAPANIYSPSKHDITKISQRANIQLSGLGNFTVSSSEGIIEFPVSVVELCKLRIPVAGGFYFRFFPLKFTEFAIKKKNKENVPVMAFLHPWETHTKTPRLKMSRLSSFVTYFNIEQTLPKLEELLKTFKFGRIKDVLFHLPNHIRYRVQQESVKEEKEAEQH